MSPAASAQKFLRRVVHPHAPSRSSRDGDPPALWRYTGARLSPAGQVALTAERGEIAPVPVGLINGNTCQWSLADGADDGGRIERRPGAPFRSARGRPGPRLRRGPLCKPGLNRPLLVIDNFPPSVNPFEALQAIADSARKHRWAADYPGLHRRTRLPVRDVRDLSDRAECRIACIPELRVERWPERPCRLFRTSRAVRSRNGR